MLETKKVTKGLLVKKQHTYVEEPTTGVRAIKKHRIVDELIGTGAQLTLMATVLEQLAEKAELDTPEYDQAKVVFAKIRGILNE